MAQLDVEPKKNNSNDWWKWLLGILAAIIIIWLILEYTGDENEAIENEPDPITAVEYKTSSASPVLEV